MMIFKKSPIKVAYLTVALLFTTSCVVNDDIIKKQTIPETVKTEKTVTKDNITAPIIEQTPLSPRLLENKPMLAYKDVQEFADEIIKKHNLDRDKVNEALSLAYFNPDVIKLLDRPAEKIGWDTYHTRLVTKARLTDGKEYLKEHKDDFDMAEKKGVSPQVIAAIIGIESTYGKAAFRRLTIESLGTLAFEYPRRSKFFRNELEQLFILADKQGSDPLDYIGSYAGAIGYPQFMPSNVLKFGTNAHGEVFVDIVNSHSDSIASVATYLKSYKFKPDGKLLLLVTLKKPLPEESFTLTPCAPEEKKKTVKELKKLGVEFPWGVDNKEKGILSKVENDDGTFQYVVFFDNACPIHRYNPSLKYTMAVSLLAIGLK